MILHIRVAFLYNVVVYIVTELVGVAFRSGQILYDSLFLEWNNLVFVTNKSLQEGVAF